MRLQAIILSIWLFDRNPSCTISTITDQAHFTSVSAFLQNTIFTVVMTIMIIANTINMGGQLDLVLFLMFACLKSAPGELKY